MILNESFTLSNGVQIPKLGLGTWFIEDGHAAEAKSYEDAAKSIDWPDWARALLLSDLATSRLEPSRL